MQLDMRHTLLSVLPHVPACLGHQWAAGQSVALFTQCPRGSHLDSKIFAWSRHCLHTLVTWRCARRNMGPRNSDNDSEDFILVPSRSLTLQGYSLPDHYWPTAKPVMQDDVADIPRLFFYLSHVLSVNLFSSLKWTESQWKTYHSSVRVRVPIVSQALWCWFWFSPWAVWSETCRSVACLRSFSRVLTVLLLPLTQRSRYCPSAALMPFYAPVHCTLCIHLQASPPHS